MPRASNAGMEKKKKKKIKDTLMVTKPLHSFQTTHKHAANCTQGRVCHAGEGRDAEGLLLPFPFL